MSQKVEKSANKMRFAEISGIAESNIIEGPTDDDMVEALTTILNHELKSADNSAEMGDNKISFVELVHTMRNLGHIIDFDGFKQIYDMTPSMQNLVKNFDKDFITLNTEEEVEVDVSDEANIDEPSQNKVDSMAKRALKKRS